MPLQCFFHPRPLNFWNENNMRHQVISFWKSHITSHVVPCTQGECHESEDAGLGDRWAQEQLSQNTVRNHVCKIIYHEPPSWVFPLFMTIETGRQRWGSRDGSEQPQEWLIRPSGMKHLFSSKRWTFHLKLLFSKFSGKSAERQRSCRSFWEKGTVRRKVKCSPKGSGEARLRYCAVGRTWPQRPLPQSAPLLEVSGRKANWIKSSANGEIFRNLKRKKCKQYLQQLRCSSCHSPRGHRLGQADFSKLCLTAPEIQIEQIVINFCSHAM